MIQYQQPGMSTEAKVMLAVAVAAVLYYVYTNMNKAAATVPPVIVPTDPNAPSGGKPVQTPVAPPVPKWNYKGCFKDNGNRVMTDMLGVMDYNSCQSAAVAKGYNVLGLQYHEGYGNTQNSQCLAGKDSPYDMYGPTDTCVFNDGGGHVHGASFANAVYKLE